MSNGLLGTIDIIMYGLIGFVILMLVGVIFVIFLLTRQFKHTFIRKIVTGGTPIIELDKAKEWTDKKTGVIYWRLLKSKHTIARPPSDALHPTKKGAYSVTAYYLGDINYKYSVSDLDKDLKTKIETIEKDFRKDVLKNVPSLLKSKLIDLKSKSVLSLAYFKPTPLYVYTSSQDVGIEEKTTITTNQRLIVHDQIKKAIERKHKGIAQYVPLIAGIASLVILIALMFIFWGDIVAPIVDIQKENTQITASIANIATKLDNTARIMAGVIQERQYLTDTGGAIPLINRTVPE